MHNRSLTNLGATKWWTVHKRRIKDLWERFNSLHSSFCCPSCTICALSDTSVQIQNTLLRENKNTFTLLSGKSMTSPCLFMCSRNLITESLTTHGEAFSSIIVSLCRDWPRYKCSEPKRKPSLVPGSKPYTRSLSLQITWDFLFLYLGLCPSSVCVYSVQKNPTENHRIYLGYLTNYYAQEKQILYFIIMCGGFSFQSLSCPDISYIELWCRTSPCLCSNIQMVNILITRCSDRQLTPLLSIDPSNTAVYLNHQDMKHTA